MLAVEYWLIPLLLAVMAKPPGLEQFPLESTPPIA